MIMSVVEFRDMRQYIKTTASNLIFSYENQDGVMHIRMFLSSGSNVSQCDDSFNVGSYPA